MFEELKSLLPNQIAKKLCDNEGTLIIDKNKPSFCDCEILDYRDPFPDLRQILKVKWVKEWKNFTNNVKHITYKSDNGDKLIVYKDIDDQDLRYLMLITSDFYLIVVEYEGHPGIDSNLFNYGNSDGSGPDLLNDTSTNEAEFRDGNFAIMTLLQYYYEFLCDTYH